MPRSQEDIDELKRQWLADGCWDIEDTEGFEEHKLQLLQFRQEVERKWEVARMGEIQNKAVELGCPDNLKLAAYVMSLENKLNNLQSQIDRIEAWAGRQ